MSFQDRNRKIRATLETVSLNENDSLQNFHALGLKDVEDFELRDIEFDDLQIEDIRSISIRRSCPQLESRRTDA